VPPATGCLPFLLLACLPVLLPARALAQNDRIVPLDGAAIHARVERIDPAQVHLAGGKAFDLQQIQRIERNAKIEPKRASAIVHLLDGSAIRAQEVAISADGAQIRWAGEPISLPLYAVRGVRLAAPEANKIDPAPLPAFEQALASAPKQDAIYVPVDGQIQVIEGAIQKLDDREVEVVWNGAVRKIARAKPYGLTLAMTKAAPDLTGLVQARLVDGSTFWGRVKSFDGSRLVLTAFERDIAIPWAAIAQLRVRSERVTFLSDLEPVEVIEESIVAFAGPWRRDRSVLNNPITLGDVVYERGIGTHARSVLTFAADEQYATFSATIGIDAETKGRGDCVFKVIADGKEIFSQRIKAQDKPAPVRLDIAGAKRIALAVEPGEDLDLADHANWADARFEKPAK
jgi:hypothetical protein